MLDFNPFEAEDRKRTYIFVFRIGIHQCLQCCIREHTVMIRHLSFLLFVS